MKEIICFNKKTSKKHIAWYWPENKEHYCWPEEHYTVYYYDEEKRLGHEYERDYNGVLIFSIEKFFELYILNNPHINLFECDII